MILLKAAPNNSFNRRAFKPDKGIVSKIFISLAAALGVLLVAGLLFLVFVAFRWLPESVGAPQLGQKAPDFTLTDVNNKPVTLAQLLSEPINNKPPRAGFIKKPFVPSGLRRTVREALDAPLQTA